MNLNVSYTKTITIFLLGGMMLLASCEKSESDEHSETSGAKGTCTLLPPTVTIEPFGAGTATSRSGKVSPEEQVCSITDKMVNTITVENISEEDTPDETLKTRADAFTDGVYYRLVIYKQSEWGAGMAIAEQRLCKIGDTHYYNVDGTTSDVPINVSAGDYKVFCYSFNNTTPIALLPTNSTNLEVSNGKDFMSAVVDLTIGADKLGSTVSIPISLTHRCCKLTGTLAAEDFVDNKILAGSPTPELKVVGSFYSIGTWTIASELLNGKGSQTNTTVNLDLAPNADNTKYFGSTFILPVSDQILSATYNFKPTSAPKAAADTKALSTKAKPFQGGTHVSFTIKAVGVYELTLPGPATIGGVKWAAKNLGQNKSFESQPWISGLWDGSSVPPASGTLSNDSKNDYWRWNVSNVDLDKTYPDLPPSNGTTWESSKDPCRQLPGGTWRVPTRDNMQSLVDAKLSNKWVKINNEAPKKTNSYGWLDANGTRAPGTIHANTPSNVIFLPATGDRLGNSYEKVGTRSYYWSSTLDASASNYAYYLDIASYNISVNSLYGRYMGYSLRCVQD